MGHVQNAGQIMMKMANKYFDGVTKLKYLGMTLKHQYCVREEMKNRLSSAKPANMWSKIFSSFFILETYRSKCTELQVCMLCYMDVKLFLTLKEVCGLRMFKSKVLRKMSGQKKCVWRKLCNEGLYDL
jgi:hypothetical protein